MLSVLFQLRFLFASQPVIMGKALGIVYRAISTHIAKRISRFLERQDLLHSWGFYVLIQGNDDLWGQCYACDTLCRMKTSIIHTRIDADLKISVENVLKRIGLSSSEAVRMFYRQIELNQGIPF
jgi:hypothetical protein